MMKIKYCEKCHNSKRIKNINEVNKDLEKILKNKVENKCVAYCGPGKKKHFIEINDEIIEADDYEKLINKVKEKYDN